MSDERVVGDTTVSRRSFLKWSAVLGGTVAVVGGGLKLGLEATGQAAAAGEDQIVWNSCNVNCGSRCALRVHVRDGKIWRVDTDNTGTDEFGNHQVRACVRGRTIRQRVYNPDRLKYPMKRSGKRGEGKFTRISWDEAFTTIASELTRIKNQYGPESILIHYATGALGGTVNKSWSPAASPIARLMNTFGGYLNIYGTYSTGQISAALPYTYGSGAGNSIEDIANTRLVVFFGNNPSETRMSGGGITYMVKMFKQMSGAKCIVIDPRFTDTAVAFADEWIPIRPGTDAALVSGMAYVMINENLVDQAFLDKYCLGFDETHMPDGSPANASYKSYITGLGADKTPKTPDWAASITGIPADTIVRLAREIAMTKPAYISQGWGPQRQANGEETCRAIAMLPIMTGNVGIKGGNTGAREGSYSMPVASFPTLTNPIKTSISFYTWPDAIMHGADMTATKDGIQGKDKLSVPVKFIWNYAGNALINQHSDTNGTAKILQDDTKAEMIVVIDNHLTPSAKFADILLPDCTNFEYNDIVPQGSSGNMGYVIYSAKAIDPMFECKTVYDMCWELSKKLGTEAQFTEGRTLDDWLKYVVAATQKLVPTFPDYDAFAKMGIFKMKNPGTPSIALKTFRDDPVANKLTTPSGKIEIYSPRLATLAKTWTLPQGDVITPLPEYTPTWEGPADPLRSKYPLQMITNHYKQRTHSTYGNVPWMKEAAPQEFWINPIDAQTRGIKHGDMVRVFNDRGQILLPAKVTTRIMPGVTTCPQGAWYNPDAKGVDVGGCANTLTNYHPSPLAKANPQHTNLVQVEKA